MDIRWIEDFLSVAETRSFSITAERRHITQSALSRRIRRLEDWVGVSLFDRSSYPVELTKSGRQFLKAARQILDTLEEARSLLQPKARRKPSALRIAVPQTLSQSFVPNFFRKIEWHLLGDITVHVITSAVASSLAEMLQHRICDLALCYGSPELSPVLDPSRFVTLAVGQDRLIPVSAPSHTGDPQYSLPGPAREGCNGAMLFQGNATFIGQLIEQKFLSRMTQYRIPRIEDSLVYNIKKMALDGHGFAWLPEGFIAEELAIGKLVRAGGKDWDLNLDILVGRSPRPLSSQSERLWASLGGTVT